MLALARTNGLEVHDALLRFRGNIARLLAIPQDFGLDLKKIVFDGGGPPDAPQERRGPQHQIATAVWAS
jgi:hypothetical protein